MAATCCKLLIFLVDDPDGSDLLQVTSIYCMVDDPDGSDLLQVTSISLGYPDGSDLLQVTSIYGG